jgi:hypothetical protein
MAYSALGVIEDDGTYLTRRRRARPALDEHVWMQLDRALDEAWKARRLPVVIALATHDAERIAATVYTWPEPEPSPTVIAIGHEDRTVCWYGCVYSSVKRNEPSFDGLIANAERALRDGDLAGALLSVASSLRWLRGLGHPPPIPPPRSRT